jgi:NarL family two-component system response regulator LiaR
MTQQVTAPKTKRTRKRRAGVDLVQALVIDDQLVFRLGLRMYLAEAMPEVEFVGDAASVREGLALVERARPNLILLDAFLPDEPIDGVLGQIKEHSPGSRVVLLANFPDSKNLAQALNAGASGYLLKTAPPEQLVSSLREVLAGRSAVQPELMQRLYADVANSPAGAQPHADEAHDLTPRQIEVLRLIARGLRNAEIADQLSISQETVKTHIANLLSKLGVKTRVQAANYAIRNKLVEV